MGLLDITRGRKDEYSERRDVLSSGLGMVSKQGSNLHSTCYKEFKARHFIGAVNRVELYIYLYTQ